MITGLRIIVQSDGEVYAFEVSVFVGGKRKEGSGTAPDADQAWDEAMSVIEGWVREAKDGLDKKTERL